MQRDLPGRHALSGAQAAFEATPLVVDGTLYLSTPFNRVSHSIRPRARSAGRMIRTSMSSFPTWSSPPEATAS